MFPECCLDILFFSTSFSSVETLLLIATSVLLPASNQNFPDHLQMDLRFYPQVVRMTRCESTARYPEMLRDMVTFLGFRWAPEYQVFEQQREFDQTYYQAIVYILSDDGMSVVHRYEAVGSTVDMAVQQAAYVSLTVLRADYWGFDDSIYRHIPRG